MSEVIHIAGLDITVNQQLRQRCGWCGATLVDYALDRIAVPIGQEQRPPTWTVGALVAVLEPASWEVEHADGDKLPAECCAVLDPEVTR